MIFESYYISLWGMVVFFMVFKKIDSHGHVISVFPQRFHGEVEDFSSKTDADLDLSTMCHGSGIGSIPP